MEKSASADSFLAKLSAGLGEFSKSRRALVAVSGGRDSVALLHGLHALGLRRLVVIHLDHRLRARASQTDARFVRRLSEKLGYPCLVGRAETKSYAATRGVSIELAARELRHAFFARCARQERCATILLAHHADDQIETCLFNFLRGSGASGLAGMKPRAEHGSFALLRPLLAIRRSEIDAFVTRQKIKFREDATNAELAATRNKLRHRVLPAIRESLGDSFGDAILRTAEILDAEDAWMDAEAAEFSLTDELSVAPLKPLPLALQRRILRHWLSAQGFQPAFELVETVRGLLVSNAIAKVNLPGGCHARRRQGKIFLERP